MSMTRLKSPASWLFTQPFIQAQIKESSSKLRVTGLCEENSPVTGEFPAQMFPSDDVIMICVDILTYPDDSTGKAQSDDELHFSTKCDFHALERGHLYDFFRNTSKTPLPKSIVVDVWTF